MDDGKSTAGVEESKGEEGVSFATPSTAALRRPVHEERQLTFLEALHVVLQTFERRYQHLITPGARDVWRRMLDRVRFGVGWGLKGAAGGRGADLTDLCAGLH